MIEEILERTEEYKSINDKTSRKQKGQFFTSKESALYMGKAGSFLSEQISILEPGAGNGILCASVLEYCIRNNLCKAFQITFVENDKTVIPLLKSTIQIIHEYAKGHSATVSCNIIQGNFLTEHIEGKYDLVICNPPYKKVRKDSPEAVSMKEYVHGQPNLYSLFMIKGFNLLKENGKFIYITPRSWTSGDYYKTVRKTLLGNLDIDRILLFRERDTAFNAENVLQETMILCAERRKSQKRMIRLDTVDNDTFGNKAFITVPSEYIKDIGEEHYLFLPTDSIELDTVKRMSGIGDTLASLGYEFRTGPVVEFRNREMLECEKRDDTVPMYRSANISKNGFVFPADTKKPQYISIEAKKSLIRNENTVLVKRLCPKEEKRRLQSCVYYKQGDNEYISIENHVNYLARKDKRPLTNGEVEWVNTILMSADYDIYYRIVNGSTQANAKELNRLPVRRRKEIEEEC